MSLAPPLPPPRLGVSRRDAVLFAAGRFSVISARVTPQNLSSGRSGGVGRACCLFSGSGGGRKMQEVARRDLESALGPNKTDFEKWGVGTTRRQHRDRCGNPAAGGGGGWSGGGGGWFRWFTSGGFWDAAKQTILTILGIFAVFFLIANFNVLVAAVVNPLLIVLRQIRRALSFVAQCVSQGISMPDSRPKSTSIESGDVAALPVKGRVGMSAKERVIRKWGID